jgi:hypothetical protein
MVRVKRRVIPRMYRKTDESKLTIEQVGFAFAVELRKS